MGVFRRKGKGTTYTGKNLDYVAFPMGGIGAGMLCLEGNGGFTNFSVRNKPEVFNQPCMFSAFRIKGKTGSARVLEGAIPDWKIFGRPGAGNGFHGTTFGFPRCRTESFNARFPFASVSLKYPADHLKVEVTGWSPFVPGNADDSSLPAAAIEYAFVNTGKKELEGIYSFHASNFNFIESDKSRNSVLSAGKGFILHYPGGEEQKWDRGSFCAVVTDAKAKVNCRWFRGGWFLTTLWKEIEEGRCIANPPFGAGEPPGPGGSIYVPVKIPPGGKKTVKLLFSWYYPDTDLRTGFCKKGETKNYHKPWYSGRFKNINDISGYWRKNYGLLKAETLKFTDCFYKMSLPAEIVDAVAANLAILKSPTVLRQTDGRLWCWEGSCDSCGCCSGSCTHVWNYAQAFPHLFPGLERTLRETEFNEMQDYRGHQEFRAWLPIRPSIHKFHAAADGQLGGIMKIYRDWRISGDTVWLKGLWEKVKKSLDYCIETWDPGHKGILEEPHHNTYDVEFWGPDGMCGSFYLGALKAACLMAEALGDSAPLYRGLYEKGRKYLESHLFNGEYFYQKIRWKGLKATDPTGKKFLQHKSKGREAIRRLYKSKKYAGIYFAWTKEVMRLIIREGPNKQYGKGCLSDGVLGVWIGGVCGIDDILDDEKVRSHLLSVFRYNFRKSLVNHVNPQRPGFALGDDGGLLLCTWPKGERLSLPFPYTEEVWTGFEYQVASHLMMCKQVRQAMDIIRTARRRHDGTRRNPFDEYECGHWYGRALSSYGLLQGFSGIRYDAVEKTLYIKPALKGSFSSFLCTSTGYGLAGVKGSKPFIRVYSGKIEVKKIEYKKAC